MILLLVDSYPALFNVVNLLRERSINSPPIILATSYLDVDKLDALLDYIGIEETMCTSTDSLNFDTFSQIIVSFNAHAKKSFLRIRNVDKEKIYYLKVDQPRKSVPLLRAILEGRPYSHTFKEIGWYFLLSAIGNHRYCLVRGDNNLIFCGFEPEYVTNFKKWRTGYTRINVPLLGKTSSGRICLIVDPGSGIPGLKNTGFLIEKMVAYANEEFRPGEIYFKRHPTRPSGNDLAINEINILPDFVPYEVYVNQKTTILTLMGKVVRDVNIFPEKIISFLALAEWQHDSYRRRYVDSFGSLRKDVAFR